MTVAARYPGTPGVLRSTPPAVAVPASDSRRLSSTVFVAGVLTILVGAWGALAPMVGPEFNFIANRTQSFTPTQSNVWLSLVPGAVAVVCGVLIAGSARTVAGRLRPDLWLLGLVAAFAGAWFCIGQYAWPALGGARYIAPADSITYLWRQFGFTVGVGMVLVLLGAMTMGWAGRRGVRLPVSSAANVVPIGGTQSVPAAPVASGYPAAPFQPAPYQAAPYQPAPYQAAPSTAAVPAVPVAQVAPVVQETPTAWPVTQTTPAVAQEPAPVAQRYPEATAPERVQDDRPTIPSPPA